MDIRIFRTRQQIKSAYLKLRESHPPERIRVKDICEVAGINKTTFYKHYTDTYELAQEIDNSCVEKVLSRFKEKYALLENPSEYIEGLLRAMREELDDLKAVFHDRGEILCAKLEEKLQRYYENTDMPDERIKTSFIIGGFIGVLRDYLYHEKHGGIKQALAEYISYISLIGNTKKAKNAVT